MARIDYDLRTASAFKASREVPRQGLEGWRKAVHRHLRPTPGSTVLDIGAGTGVFATAFADWFGVRVVAVEPSAAMRDQLPQHPNVEVVEGNAEESGLPDACADGAWLSTVIHHVPDLDAAAREVRRVLRPGAPVLVRSPFPGRHDRIEMVRWFPETTRTLDTYPTVERVQEAFVSAGFSFAALEAVPQQDCAPLGELLARVDHLRAADTLMRSLTDEEFARGRERLRQAVNQAAPPGPRTSWLDLLVLR